ncbi:MAG: AAA family ATPase [Candidatus Eisenbacteria sp.]|nr:AAA family ATPase [Candidatus Eisenbacteria bacterium]
MAIGRGTVTAIVGKGGTGKTTLSGLLVRRLLADGLGPVLAVDADPAQGFGKILGVEPTETLGEIREGLLRPGNQIPAGVAKKGYLDLRVQSSIVEASGFDLLTMGRPEGPGCYCFVNNLLRDSLDSLVGNYPWVVIDCEAGMEHLSRRTAKDVDYLFVVCNGSLASVQTASRILDLIEDLRTKAAHRILILNNLAGDTDEVVESLLDRIDAARFDTSGVIPYNQQVSMMEREGQSILDLPDESPVSLALEHVLGKIRG